MKDDKDVSAKRFAVSGVHCPSCREKLDREEKWCPRCGFTGSKSLDMFGDTPPPLLPILDAAELWGQKELKLIGGAIIRFQKRFPQFHWRICTVALGPEVSLPVFGFWLMNVCPLLPDETDEDREWSILLVIDSKSGRASVTPGYSAEVWLSDEMWETALLEVADPFRYGYPEQAVVQFLKSAEGLFEEAWKRSKKKTSK